MRRSNGVFLVVAFGHEFLVYCAMGSHACQLLCLSLQKRRRYCSRDWLVLSLWPSAWGWNAVLMF